MVAAGQQQRRQDEPRGTAAPSWPQDRAAPRRRRPSCRPPRRDLPVPRASTFSCSPSTSHGASAPDFLTHADPCGDACRHGSSQRPDRSVTIVTTRAMLQCSRRYRRDLGEQKRAERPSRSLTSATIARALSKSPARTRSGSGPSSSAAQSTESLGRPARRRRSRASPSNAPGRPRRRRTLRPDGRAATRRSAGLSPPVETATVTGPSRCTAGRMKEEWARSSALLTQTPAASASSWTAPSTSGRPVAVTTSRKPPASPRAYARRSTVCELVGECLHLGRERRGDHGHGRAAVEEGAGLTGRHRVRPRPRGRRARSRRARPG